VKLPWRPDSGADSELGRRSERSPIALQVVYLVILLWSIWAWVWPA
jgi:hypothetical protein